MTDAEREKKYNLVRTYLIDQLRVLALNLEVANTVDFVFDKLSTKFIAVAQNIGKCIDLVNDVATEYKKGG